MTKNQAVRAKKGEKKDNRGGKREGAGRPPSFFSESDTFRRELVKAERTSVANGEKSMADVLVDMAKGNDKRTAIQAQKVFWNLIIVPVTEKPEDVEKRAGPGVYLPEERPDPAKVIPFKQEIGNDGD